MPPPKAVVIGASAGAVEALSAILPKLDQNFPVAVIIVVHIPADRRSALAELFGAKCKMRVEEAEDKALITPGTIYFAPPDYHVLIESDRSLSLSTDEPVLFSRPSIDVLFESAADAYGPDLLGIVLSGANQDGANGLRAVMDCGGTGLVQDPTQAYARAMPDAAMRACPTARVVDLDQIVRHLKEF